MPDPGLSRGPVLCLGVHPDDLELSMGAALLALARAGVALHVWIATDGERGTRQPARGSRRDEARAALAPLGVVPTFGGLPDGALAEVMDLEATVAALAARARPALVFGPTAADPHADHAALGRSLDRLEAAPGWPPTWRWLDAGPAVEPTHFLDPGPSAAEKLRLIGYHRSQIPGPGEPRDHLPGGLDIVERAEARDRSQGVRFGRASLEPFLAPAGRRGEGPRLLDGVRGFFGGGAPGSAEGGLR
ncbi:MAG: PIG-L family deacetylase [Planctomycetota bacterium]